MSPILVEFHIEEAEGMLKRLGIEQMSPAEADAARSGAERLRQAVLVERGPSGSEAEPTLHEQAEALVGQPVTVFSLHGTKVGTLDGIREAKLLCIRHGVAVSRVPMELVTGIQAGEALGEAA